jgi:hypothetical protein
MTVSSTINREQYATDGVATAFAIHFPFFDDTDVNAVYVDALGSATPLALNADYTVSGGGGAGGTLNAMLAPASGGALTIYREIPFVQEDDYVEDDPLPADTLEGGFDRAVMRDQQLKDAQNRALTFPVTIDAAVSAELPSPQADRLLGWKADGSGLENKSLPAGTAVYASFASTNAGLSQAEAVTPFALASSNLAAEVHAATAGVAAAAALPGPNKIINGGMDIAQRGTSFAAAVSNTYSLDRWNWGAAGTGVVTITQAADAPPNSEFQNSLRVTVTTADAAIAAGDVYLVQQHIEGYNARDLIGRDIAISFWVRSAKTGVHCAYLNNGVNDRAYLMPFTVNAANTWEKKALSVPGGLITAGTWNWTTGKGLSFGFALAAGATWQAAAGTWQTGNFCGIAGAVNCLDTVGNIFAITGVQLEQNSAATPFEHRPLQQEIALCERYYQKSFPLTIAPAQNAGLFNGWAQPAGAAVGQTVTFVPFRTRMRVSPTALTLYNPLAANAQARNTATNTDWSSTAAAVLNETGLTFTGTSPGGSAAGNLCGLNWAADAEL